MELKVIFLDIDGVLNLMRQEYDEYGSLFHENFVDNLKYIIDETEAKIVISSTWRLSGLKIMREMWNMRSLPGEIIDITPTEIDVVNKGICEFYDLVNRGHEIQLYIDTHNITKYCIIDDDNDFLEHQKQFLVRTSNNRKHPDALDIGYGLTKLCSEKAISILNS